jgi:hypothetical protein
MRPHGLTGASDASAAPPILPTLPYAAYLAYAAYVENGMPMQLRHYGKTGCYRVLRENVAIPMIQNPLSPLFSQLSMFIRVPQRNPCGHAHQQLQRNIRVPLPTSINNVGKGLPQDDDNAIVNGKRQFSSPIPKGARA